MTGAGMQSEVTERAQRGRRRLRLHAGRHVGEEGAGGAEVLAVDAPERGLKGLFIFIFIFIFLKGLF